MNAKRPLLCAVVASLAMLGACRATTPSGAPDPMQGEVPLGSTNGFDASLVFESDCGVWTVAALPVIERYATPEIVALDDKGRCTVLMSYSGRWFPWTAVHEGRWLGGLTFGDVDPRRDGPELYVGGTRGSVYQIVAHPDGGFDANRLAIFPGEEVYTLIAADLDRSLPGTELIAFSAPGAAYLLRPDDDAPTGFAVTRLADVPGRVRDAVVLDHRDPPVAITVSRGGTIDAYSLVDGTLTSSVVYEQPMGFSRIERKPTEDPSEPAVLYAAADDGRILRLQERTGGTFDTRVIYNGPQGARGVVPGRFTDDPTDECVAIFGYSGRVELLTRPDGATAWTAQTVFTDTDKGHWLARAELDGRNATDELVTCGYSGRVVLLARPPGYGVESAATR